MTSINISNIKRDINPETARPLSRFKSNLRREFDTDNPERFFVASLTGGTAAFFLFMTPLLYMLYRDGSSIGEVTLSAACLVLIYVFFAVVFTILHSFLTPLPGETQLNYAVDRLGQAVLMPDGEIRFNYELIDFQQSTRETLYIPETGRNLQHSDVRSAIPPAELAAYDAYVKQERKSDADITRMLMQTLPQIESSGEEKTLDLLKATYAKNGTKLIHTYKHQQ